jgi:hypothetical protein
MGWRLYVCLHVLNLDEQECAWIIRDKHRRLGDTGHGGEVLHEISEV